VDLDDRERYTHVSKTHSKKFENYLKEKSAKKRVNWKLRELNHHSVSLPALLPQSPQFDINDTTATANIGRLLQTRLAYLSYDIDIVQQQESKIFLETLEDYKSGKSKNGGYSKQEMINPIVQQELWNRREEVKLQNAIRATDYSDVKYNDGLLPGGEFLDFVDPALMNIGGFMTDTIVLSPKSTTHVLVFLNIADQVSGSYSTNRLAVPLEDLIMDHFIDMFFKDEEDGNSSVPLYLHKVTDYNIRKTTVSGIYSKDDLIAVLESFIAPILPGLCLQVQKYVKCRGDKPWVARIECETHQGACRVHTLRSKFILPKNRLKHDISKWILNTEPSVYGDSIPCTLVSTEMAEKKSSFKEPCTILSEIASLLKKSHSIKVGTICGEFFKSSDNKWFLLKIIGFKNVSKLKKPHFPKKEPDFDPLCQDCGALTKRRIAVEYKLVLEYRMLTDLTYSGISESDKLLLGSTIEVCVDCDEKYGACITNAVPKTPNEKITIKEKRSNGKTPLKVVAFNPQALNLNAAIYKQMIERQKQWLDTNNSKAKRNISKKQETQKPNVPKISLPVPISDELLLPSPRIDIDLFNI